MRIRDFNDAQSGAWDDFVRACPQATFFHRAGWKGVIERVYGHRTHYLLAEQDGAICGVLPLVHFKHPLFGNALISNGFCVYGGPATELPEADVALSAAAQALAERLGVAHVEFRTMSGEARAGWRMREGLYATFRKEIVPDVERNMLAIPRKQRAMVRKGQKLGLTSALDPTPARFFPVYAESVRNLGTPVFPRRYFEALKTTFTDDCEILTVTHEDMPVSSVMSFRFRGEILPYYGGGTARARALAGNDFMYWEVMRRACEAGLHLFDFGRSKYGTGAFEFKKHWGFAPQPLAYRYLLRDGAAMPDLNPLNPKFSLFIALWKRLPLPVANAIGPHIVRHLG